jgi:hypothetical protein
MDLVITACSLLHGNKVMVNDRLIHYQENIPTFADFIKQLYRQEQVSYPKFFKMDNPGKLGFMAAELVAIKRSPGVYAPDRVGVVLANSSSSLDTDLAHQETIKNRSAYFPSPSVFVYTLPNIMIGEICIRHKIKGENAFLISEQFDSVLLCGYVEELFSSNRVDACICGWVELLGNNYTAFMVLVERGTAEAAGEETPWYRKPFTPGTLDTMMNNNC